MQHLSLNLIVYNTADLPQSTALAIFTDLVLQYQQYTSGAGVYYYKYIPIWLCIVSPPKAGEQYERTAILYHQQYTSKLGDKYIVTVCFNVTSAAVSAQNTYSNPTV